MRLWFKREDFDLIQEIKNVIGIIILLAIVVFVLTINIAMIPIDLARKPVRNFVYRQKKYHKTPA